MEGPPAHYPPSIVVRDVQFIGHDLAHITLRTEQGDIRHVIVPIRLATMQTVAIAAHAVSSLIAMGRI